MTGTVKVYQSTLGKILIMLLMCKHREIDYDSARRWVIDNYDRAGMFDDNMRHYLERFMDKDNSRMTFAELIEEVQLGAMAESSNGNDGEMIEGIIEAIQMPYGRNHFSNYALGHLRKTLLLPSERRNIVEVLKKEIRCAACDHPFTSGEMGTYQQVGTPDGRQQQAQFVCTKCKKPVYVACETDQDCHVLVGDLKLPACEITHVDNLVDPQERRMNEAIAWADVGGERTPDAAPGAAPMRLERMDVDPPARARLPHPFGNNRNLQNAINRAAGPPVQIRRNR